MLPSTLPYYLEFVHISPNSGGINFELPFSPLAWMVLQVQVGHILNSMMATFLAWSKVSFSCVLETPLCHLQCSKIHPVIFHYQGLFLATFYLELVAACLFMELKLSVPYYCLQIWLIYTSPARASNIFFQCDSFRKTCHWLQYVINIKFLV